VQPFDDDCGMSNADATGAVRVREQIAKKTERMTVFVLAVLGLIYGFFFLPEPVLELFKSRFHSIGGVLANMGFSAMIAVTIGAIIMAQDILATTKLRAAKFFREQYPTEKIKSEYNCDQAQADYLWFQVFNPMREITHPRHLSYVMTFQRSYACRFIFIVRWSLLFFIVLAAGTWLAAWYFQFDDSLDSSIRFALQYSRAFLLIVALIITAVLFVCNRLKPATGCWALWKEINNIHKAWLEEAMSKKAAKYNDALKLFPTV
jgi:hypothetical protein